MHDTYISELKYLFPVISSLFKLKIYNCTQQTNIAEINTLQKNINKISPDSHERNFSNLGEFPDESKLFFILKLENSSSETSPSEKTSSSSSSSCVEDGSDETDGILEESDLSELIMFCRESLRLIVLVRFSSEGSG